MNTFALAVAILMVKPASASLAPRDSGGIIYSPYNWYQLEQSGARTANPGAYLKFDFTGTRVGVNFDVSPLVKANVPATQYPVVGYSIDGGKRTTIQLSPTTKEIVCGKGLPKGKHQLLFQYVSGYVFLDFWTPVNAITVTSFTLDNGNLVAFREFDDGTPVVTAAPVPKFKPCALFLGDSITNGDDDIATFKDGITNAVDTQDATLAYPNFVAAGLGEEFGIVAYGGASWDHTAADGHTPGLMTFYSMLDSVHSRLDHGKLLPTPNDIFINMGENSPPTGEDVPNLLTELRAASGAKTNIFVIVPFSGRSRAELTAGLDAYRVRAPKDARVYLLDLGNNPYLTDAGPTQFSVDGQHPLATLHAKLAAQILAARAKALAAAKR